MRPKGARYKMRYYGGSTSIGIRRQSLSRLNLHNIVASTCIAHRVSCIVIFLAFFTFLPFFPISSVYGSPQMADYCYLPPFVTDPNTPPNIMVTLDKTSWGMSRAYKSSYDSTKSYYGFFDSNGKYKYDTNGYFIKIDDATCTSLLTAANKYNCFPGGLLDWALMSALDLTKKAMVGYGFVSSSENAGDKFIYSGDLIAKGLVNSITIGTSDICNISFAGGTYSYYFDITNPTGSNNKPAKVTINVRNDATCPTSSCSGVCKTPVSNKEIAMKYTDESRIGIYQKYADTNQDLYDDYPNSKARFGMVRWKLGSGGDKGIEIFDDSINVIAADKTEFFKSFLNVTSSSPPTDPGGNPLGEMMHDLVNYFRKNATYTTHSSDIPAYTQSPYDWSKDPARACRKNFALFVTSGADLTDPSPLSSTCPNDTDTYRTAFSQDACYGYTTDLYTTDGGTFSPQSKWQNIRTYVVHTVSGITCTGTPKKCTHNNAACTTDEDCTNEEKLKYAVSKAGGEYIKVDDSSKLEAKIEEALLNILSTSASASTVATLTTQTRESSTLTQAYFYPKREGTPLRWIGYLRLLWSDSGANLREDTMNTGWLDLKKDDILSFYYDPVSVSYMARTYADSDGDLKMDNCAPSTMLNDDVLTIWNAQTKLQNATPDETKTPSDTPSGRLIKIGIGNTSGIVSGSTCVSNSGFCNFTTSLNAKLQPYWNYASYCNNYPSRWCSQDSHCNYCNTLRTTYAVDRGCSSASDCNYCDGGKTRTCSTTMTCSDETGGCSGRNVGDACGDGSGVCVGDCYKYKGTCDTGGSLGLVCDVNGTTACTGLGTACTVSGTSGTCKAKCTLDITTLCLNNNVEPDADNCIDDYHGTAPLSGCVTTDTCTTAAAGTCVNDCDADNCATQVIKFARGYDRPTNASDAITSPGNAFRLRHETITTADNTNTLKLGDIVYSTPRISPNSAVSGYDVTYKDTTYGNFVNLQMKGNCTTNTDCPGSETCSSGVCTNDGYTSIVIVGANDGMVHAFKVSKIKDISPASTTGGGVTDGYQTARFADKPRDSSDTAPPGDIGKELWAYIPWNAVPYLKWYCSESYCHIPMVDARFAVIDASIDYDKDGTVESSEDRTATDVRCTGSETGCDCLPEVGGKCTYPWRRLLIGAMGVGGKKITVGNNTWSSSVFVLDITNPATPVLLWEKPLPDNTLTTSTPAVVRLSSKLAGGNPKNDDENGKWYLVFGSGPESVTTNKLNYKTGNAKIFVFDLRTGENQTKGTDNTDMTSDDGLDIGASGVAVGDMMAVDFDSDYQVDDIYFGTYGGAGPFKGKLYRLRIRNGAIYNTPSNWTISTVVTPPGGENGRPIYASPEIAVDTLGNKWLYAGTGLYLTLEHAKPRCKDDESITCNSDSDCPTGTCGVDEYVGGFKETEACWKGSGSCSEYTNFLNTTNISFTGAKAVEVGCFCAGSLVKTISCDADGNCPPSTPKCTENCNCGDAKICVNNTSQTCSADDECPTTGLCVANECINTDSPQTCSKDSECLSTPRCKDNKVVLKVTDATLTETSGNVTSCDGQKDKPAIDCLTTQINSTNGCSGLPCNGWYRTIPKQKSFSKPFVAGGLVDFTTFQPKSTVCSLGGDTYLWALHYTTGTAYVQPTISMAGGTSVTAGGLTIKASVNLGTGVPPLGESLVALPLSGDTYKVITQVSGGLPGTTMAPSLPARSGYVLWLVK